MKWQSKYSKTFKQLKNYKRKNQRGVFLNRNDFTYVSRDKANTAIN